MKAARLYTAGDIRVEDIDIPGPLASGWVRIAVTAAGICGSDIHNFRTGQWITRSPSVAGHEFAGVVTEVGAGVRAFNAAFAQLHHIQDALTNFTLDGKTDRAIEAESQPDNRFQLREIAGADQ